MNSTKSNEPPVNRAILCQNLVFRTKKPGRRSRPGELAGLDIYQRMALLVISDMIGAGKDCFTVCQQEIAARMACGRTAASRAITSLIDAGVLKVTQRGANSSYTYAIDVGPLQKIQREKRDYTKDGPRTPRSEQRRCSSREQPQFAGRTTTVRETNSSGSPDEHVTVPVTASSLPSEGPLPPPAGEAGRGPSDEQGVSNPPPKKSKTPATHLECLNDYNRSIILDVENVVPLKGSRANPAQIGFELNELLNAHNGVQATDIIDVLESSRFQTLNQLSWGLVLFSEEIFGRFNHLLAEKIKTRQETAAAGNAPVETINLKLSSLHQSERMEAVNALADRFERTQDCSWLLRLAAVFAGKGRDSLLRVRHHALDRLYHLLARYEPRLDEKVQKGLSAAVRSAAKDEGLRLIAEVTAELLGIPNQEPCHA